MQTPIANPSFKLTLKVLLLPSHFSSLLLSLPLFFFLPLFFSFLSKLNTVVTDLNLSDNALGTEGTIAVADMLKENCYITHLDLSDNNLTSAGAYALAEMLTTNSTISHCNFSGQY